MREERRRTPPTPTNTTTTTQQQQHNNNSTTTTTQQQQHNNTNLRAGMMTEKVTVEECFWMFIVSDRNLGDKIDLAASDNSGVAS